MLSIRIEYIAFACMTSSRLYHISKLLLAALILQCGNGSTACQPSLGGVLTKTEMVCVYFNVADPRVPPRI